MVVTGFSLSPGGLMLPYHVGVLASLEYNSVLDSSSPIAGSSAGSIAVAAHASQIPPEKILEASIKVSNDCGQLGAARGRLLPFVRQLSEDLIGDSNFQAFVHRPGPAGICYKEVFPRNRSFLETTFESKQILVQAISNSCMFPFFTTNFPCLVDMNGSFPRLVVDGFFAVDRDRFGCPDFDMLPDDGISVDRTVLVSVFPSQKIGMTGCNPEDQISPSEDVDINRLFKIATQPTSREDHTWAYELGWQNADSFCRNDAKK